jgi:hypothetical protein
MLNALASRAGFQGQCGTSTLVASAAGSRPLRSLWRDQRSAYRMRRTTVAGCFRVERWPLSSRVGMSEPSQADLVRQVAPPAPTGRAFLNRGAAVSRWLTSV